MKKGSWKNGTYKKLMFLLQLICIWENLLTQIVTNRLKTSKQRKHRKKDSTFVHSISEVQSNQLLIFDNAVQLFESRCQALSHFCCQNCQMTGISIRPSKRNGSICTMCQASKAKMENVNENLPIWYDKKGKVQYHLPEQLKTLHEGEKLLIQQVAAYVPLLPLKDGQIGSRGHVCSFVQDISSICTVLPRLPNDVQFVKVVKKYQRKVCYQKKCCSWCTKMA